MKSKFGSIYFGIFGIVALAFGIAEFIATGTGGYTGRLLDLSGTFIIWRGLILFCAGALYLASIKNFTEINQLAKSVMASIMIWIVAGVEIFAKIASSIPGGEEGGWFIPPTEELIGIWTPPYIPALYLLPFSLIIIYYIYTEREEKK